ncbi:TetR/AcrR family transcriptional regulator [Nocardioides sp. R-C-SC26]|uniref:TetR/AcrR family transcriptional regulator n=1 Tax=Nocardioides sp. R-C-SC26 TaxID=2870414 RepID=UPI001E337982|nr:TetR/AcrR family transcriptional regulator [Nocardioides sp. R-C-SC26]
MSAPATAPARRLDGGTRADDSDAGTSAASPAPPALPRVRRGRGAGAETRQALISATLACLRRADADVSIAAVAREAGVSRQTVYGHFRDSDDLVHHATSAAAIALGGRIRDHVEQYTDDPVDGLVEFIVVAYREFSADPVAASIIDVTVHQTITPPGAMSEVFRYASAFMPASYWSDPVFEGRADEVVETAVRWLLSLLTYPSPHTRDDAALRAYLQRNLAPALAPVAR